jgi:hypothetical protein
VDTGASAEDDIEPLRPSEADRSAVVDRLRAELGADRLSLDGYEQRVTAVYTARTLEDLQRVSQDLPRAGDEPPSSRRRRFAPLAAVAAIALLGAGAAVVWSRGDDGRHVGVAQPSAPAGEASSPGELNEARAKAEGWFEPCDASRGLSARLGPVDGDVDRLADLVPDGTIEQYAVGTQGPVATDDSTARPWVSAALAASDATEGFAATFNEGPPGPGGWTIYAYRFDDPQTARRAVERASTALVCEFGADPWDPGVGGDVGAYLPGDSAQIFHVVGSTVTIVDWAMHQEVDEALRRASNVATVVAEHAAEIS